MRLSEVVYFLLSEKKHEDAFFDAVLLEFKHDLFDEINNL